MLFLNLESTLFIHFDKIIYQIVEVSDSLLFTRFFQIALQEFDSVSSSAKNYHNFSQNGRLRKIFGINDEI